MGYSNSGPRYRKKMLAKRLEKTGTTKPPKEDPVPEATVVKNVETLQTPVAPPKTGILQKVKNFFSKS